MIILDTNVVSEPWRPEPDARVLRWLDEHDPDEFFLTATVAGELLTGVERLPKGRRRTTLARNVDQLLRAMSDRVLPYDLTAARHLARLVVRASRDGTTVTLGDAQIAAVASVRGATVATRDVEPFEAMDVPTINPWS